MIIKIHIKSEDLEEIKPILDALKIEYFFENSEKIEEDLKLGIDKYC